MYYVECWVIIWSQVLQSFLSWKTEHIHVKKNCLQSLHLEYLSWWKNPTPLLNRFCLRLSNWSMALNVVGQPSPMVETGSAVATVLLNEKHWKYLMRTLLSQHNHCISMFPWNILHICMGKLELYDN